MISRHCKFIYFAADTIFHYIFSDCIINTIFFLFLFLSIKRSKTDIVTQQDKDFINDDNNGNSSSSTKKASTHSPSYLKSKLYVF